MLRYISDANHFTLSLAIFFGKYVIFIVIIHLSGDSRLFFWVLAIHLSTFAWRATGDISAEVFSTQWVFWRSLVETATSIQGQATRWWYGKQGNGTLHRCPGTLCPKDASSHPPSSRVGMQPLKLYSTAVVLCTLYNVAAKISFTLLSNENVTSSTKPEVHEVLQRRQRNTKPRPLAACIETFVKLGRVCGSSWDMRAGRQTYRHAYYKLGCPNEGMEGRSNYCKRQNTE